MESHELLREMLQQHSAKDISAKVGLSLQRIYQWAEPSQPAGSGTPNPLDRIDALIKATGDPRIAEWVCERAGGFFMKNPQLDKMKSVALVTASNVLIQEFATMITLIADASVDGKISPAEAEDIRARWEKIKSVTEFFVHCCEQGKFCGENSATATARAKAKP